MPHSKSNPDVTSLIQEDRVLALEQAMIRIPSSSFEEHKLADYLAERMSDVGLSVEMMTVPHPWDADKGSTRQPVGRLKGTGGGRVLMLNGHMDPGVEMSGWTVDPYAGIYEDGWVWGIGAHDDKGGLAAALSAVEAIVRSGIRLAGDVLVCPVAGHKLLGAGTRALIDDGVRADCCINMEHSANTIATTCVGIVFIRVRTQSPELFFRHNKEARAAYFNPIEQQLEIIRRLGGSFSALVPGGWLSFEPHDDLPGFPQISIDTVHREHYLYRRVSDAPIRECDMTFQIRTVPGQTEDTVRRDVERLLEKIKTDFPAFDARIFIPADGPEAAGMDPMHVEKDHPLVTGLAEGHRLASGNTPQLGGGLRLGNVGDGNLLDAAGIPSLQYGPGDIRIYDEWPAPDERVLLSDIVTAAKAIAFATCRVCA